MKKKILFLSANPGDTQRLRLDKEVREIKEGLRRSKNRDQFNIVSEWAVSFNSLRRALLDYEPQIVHFSGHGGEEGLMMEGEMGIAVSISIEALSNLFELCANHVECVILNACYSALQAVAINKHINYVIGMPGKINDHAAIEFSVGFYDALGAGRIIEDAFKFGCNAFQNMFPNISEHLIPILKIKEGIVNIRIRIETTGAVYEERVSLDSKTSEIKNHLISQLHLPGTFDDGHPIVYYLLNKTKDEILNDFKTFRENGIKENDILVFLLEK